MVWGACTETLNLLYASGFPPKSFITLPDDSWPSDHLMTSFPSFPTCRFSRILHTDAFFIALDQLFLHTDAWFCVLFHITGDSLCIFPCLVPHLIQDNLLWDFHLQDHIFTWTYSYGIFSPPPPPHPFSSTTNPLHVDSISFYFILDLMEGQHFRASFSCSSLKKTYLERLVLNDFLNDEYTWHRGGRR